jgi:predicted regulator of Ras-like GTPase activity (Roadblock/LC7/MglB family)
MTSLPLLLSPNENYATKIPAFWQVSLDGLLIASVLSRKINRKIFRKSIAITY